MPKIALIYPYFRTHSVNEILFPPLGIASLAGQLNALGLENQVFDCTFKSFEEIQMDLKSYQPDVVGIYSMITLSQSAFRIASAVRTDLPGALLIAGGPLPTLYSEQYGKVFDIVFRGETDLSFPRFCRDLFGGKYNRENIKDMPLEKYEGLFIHRGELCVENPVIHYSEKEINSFPLPYREDFDHAAYQEVWSQQDGIQNDIHNYHTGVSFQL